MKKTLKKFAAVGLSLTSVMGLVACGSNSGNQDTTKATVDWANVQTLQVLILSGFVQNILATMIQLRMHSLQAISLM